MKSSRFGRVPKKSRQKLTLCSTLSTRLYLTMLLTAILLSVLVGCRNTEVQYARSTKLPEEDKGFMRLAQTEIRVNVIGTEKVGLFSASAKSERGSALVQALRKVQNNPQVLSFLEAEGLTKEYIQEVVIEENKKAELSAYIVIHESDVAQFVENTQKLKTLLNDADVAKLVKEKGLLKKGE